jgi:competence protein ComGC
MMFGQKEAIKKKEKAFTLVEILVYLAIVSSILVFTIGFVWDVIFGDIKGNSLREVRQNGEFALIKITQEVKKAKKINFPSIGSSGDYLSLEMANLNLNPTIFNVSGGKLRITQGTGLPIELTTGEINANILFRNLSYANTPGAVRAEITISRLNPGNRMEYQASLDFKTTISLLIK